MNFLEKKIPLEERNNPHSAEQFLNIQGEIFVSGKIKHIEHKTLKLNGWFRVIKNTEVKNRSGIVGWID